MNASSLKKWAGVGLVASFLGLCLIGDCLADATKPKDRNRKPKDKTEKIVRVDLSKLPPDLAGELSKYVDRDDKRKDDASDRPAVGRDKLKDDDSKRPVAGREKDHREVRLPPGLASKAKDHPGRMAFLRRHARQDDRDADRSDKGRGGKSDKKERDDD